MPVRPRQHVLDDETERAFSSALPAEWIFRSTDRHDYGIDGTVEIFRSQRATGEVFNVQLKGTDSQDDGAGTSVLVKVDTAAYWNLLQLPTLVARYHSASGNLYIRWWHRHPFEPRPDQEQLTVKFTGDHLWRASSPADITAEVQAYHRLRSAKLELPLGVSVEHGGGRIYGVSTAVVDMLLRSSVERLPRLVKVHLAEDTSSDTATIAYSDESINVDLGGTRVSLKHDVPYGDRRPLEAVGYDSLVGIALALGRIGLSSAAASIAALALPQSTFIEAPHYLAIVGTLFRGAHRIVEGTELAKELLGKGVPAIALGAMVAELGQGNAPAAFKDEASLIKLLRAVAAAAETGNQRLAAQWWLILAKRQGAIRQDARESIRQAMSLDDSLARDVACLAELGGAAYDACEPREAIGAYESALQIAREPELVAALADSHLAAGNFQHATRLFEEYLSEGGSPNRWFVSIEVATRMAAMGHNGWPPALSSLGASVEQNDDELPQQIQYALALFNRGGELGDMGEYSQALTCYLGATVLFPGDNEAWVQAMLCAVNLQDVPMVARVIESGYRAQGYALLDEVTTRTATLDAAVRGELMEIVEMVITGRHRSE